MAYGDESEISQWFNARLSPGIVALTTSTLLFIFPRGDENKEEEKDMMKEASLSSQNREKSIEIRTNTSSTAVQNSAAQNVPASNLSLSDQKRKTKRSHYSVLSWKEAEQIDWGVIILFAGGVSLGSISFQTGLSDILGNSFLSLLPDPETTSSTNILIAYYLLSTGLPSLMSEFLSNTASANIVIPLILSIGITLALSPVHIIGGGLACTFACSCGFIMPISTPTNAIVYSSGLIPLSQMMKAGFFLDILCFGITVAIVLLMISLGLYDDIASNVTL